METAVTVRSIETVGPNTIAMEFERPEGFDARPGQFVKLTGEVEGESYSRFYTLSSPDVSDGFEVTIGIDPEEAGPFSQWLGERTAGDELDLAGPFGDQFYDDEPRAVVLAGGPGVGPAVGIGERAIETGNEVAIVYVDEQPAHEERLAAIADADGGTVRIVSESDASVDPDTLSEAVVEVLGEESDELVFVYGFSSFVDAAEAAIEAAGADPDAAKVEDFG